MSLNGLSRWLRVLVLWPILALASSAGATPLVSLSVVPADSRISPETGPAESLSGSLSFEVGELPVGGGGTAFNLIDLAVTSSGGTQLALDPDLTAPGLFVLEPSGAFSVAVALFLEITGDEVLSLAIPDVTGAATFGPGGASIESIVTDFQIDAGALGLFSVELFAVVPEPASALLLGFGLGGLALRRKRNEA